MDISREHYQQLKSQLEVLKQLAEVTRDYRALGYTLDDEIGKHLQSLAESLLTDMEGRLSRPVPPKQAVSDPYG